VTARYEALVSGGFRDDASQRAVLPLLDSLVAAMPAHHVATRAWRAEWGAWDARRRAARERLLKSEEARRRSRSESVVALMRDRMRAAWDRRTEAEVEAAFVREVEAKSLGEAGAEPPAPTPPRGVFLHGEVGVGKTFAMDLVAAAVRDVGGGTLRRVHFNELFLDMHARMHSLLQEQRSTGRVVEANSSEKKGEEEEAPVGAFHAVADELLEGEGSALVCVDEMQCNDPFTAVALSEFLGRVLSRGGVVVATSNRRPEDVNRDGFQREIFGRFVDGLCAACDVVEVGGHQEAPKDYRAMAYERCAGDGTLVECWFDGKGAGDRFSEAFHSAAAGGPLKEGAEFPVRFGRSVAVRASAEGADSGDGSERRPACLVEFEALLGSPTGAADYAALAANFDVVYLEGVPQLSHARRDLARRFITLVDELYNRKTRLVALADVSLDELFAGLELSSAALAADAAARLEDLQFEAAPEGAKLRRDLSSAGGVAPLSVGTTNVTLFTGEDETFASKRCLSRLREMQTPEFVHQFRY